MTKTSSRKVLQKIRNRVSFDENDMKTIEEVLLIQIQDDDLEKSWIREKIGEAKSVGGEKKTAVSDFFQEAKDLARKNLAQ